MSSRNLPLDTIIAQIDEHAPAPEEGLPEELFLLISRLTPLVNVDLLIQDELLGTLLTWRDDIHYGPGWHVPGGIIRFKEPISDRIHAVAREELRTTVTFNNAPLCVHESVKREAHERAHAISLLFRCRLTGPLDDQLRLQAGSPRRGQWHWHKKSPPDLIPEQGFYEPYFR